MNGKDSSSPATAAIAAAINDGSKPQQQQQQQMVPMIMPPTNADHGTPDSYVVESSTPAGVVATVATTGGTPTPAPQHIGQQQQHHHHHHHQSPAAAAAAAAGEYSPSTYIQHRGATIIYPNTPIAPPNIYFNSVYMTEAAASSLTPCSYPKNLSEHYVSDHLPKRDSKYSQKKFSPVHHHTQAKDNPPNIPKFPFFVNSSYPTFVNNRANVKDKDMGKGGNMMKIMESNGNGGVGGGGGGGGGKQPPKPPRTGNASCGGPPPKPRVFHNQGQYGNAAPRPQRNPNGQQMGHPMSVHYVKANSIGMKSNPYEQSGPQNVRPYEYQNSYGMQQTNYQKHSGYDGHRRQGQVCEGR